MNLLNGMTVIGRTKEAIYLRIPKELQEACALGCLCDYCVKQKQINPNYIPTWDTLCVSTKAPKKGNDYGWTVHMPDVSVLTRMMGK